MGEYEISGIEIVARGVCVAEGKILLCAPAKGGYSYLPGGHVEFGEKGTEALAREMREEAGLEVRVGEPLGFAESAFGQNGRRHAEVSLVYPMEICGAEGRAAEVRSREDWIRFEWRDLREIAAANLLPPEVWRFIPAAPPPSGQR